MPMATRDPKTTLLRSLLSVISNRWGLLTVGAICLLLAFQFWSAQDVKRQMSELNNLLSDTQRISLDLVKELGYGGLIHNFKNAILRPLEPVYIERAEQSARVALTLLTELEKNALNLNIEYDLDNTRDMIAAYQSRLNTVNTLHARSASLSEIDAAVRFNDELAILEIQTTVSQLYLSLNRQMDQIETRDRLYSICIIIGTFILGALAIFLVSNQHQKRLHVDALDDVNQQLEISNHQLLQANTSLQQFAGIVSHDLKSPLRHISAFNEFIMEDYNDRESVERHVSRIRNSSKRLNHMIDGLLEFTRAGFSEPNKEIVDLQELVDHVLDQLAPSIEASSTQITVDITGRVHADRELLERVLNNLIGNSIKYRREAQHAAITISTSSEGDRIRTSISDNGIGIEPTYADRIFLPLQRLHDSQSHFEGSGIGLSLVKSVIEAHGGKVWLDTDHSQGSCFHFVLDAA